MTESEKIKQLIHDYCELDKNYQKAIAFIREVSELGILTRCTTSKQIEQRAIDFLKELDK